MMFGSSLTAVPYIDWARSGSIGNTIVNGAPNGARCDDKEPLNRDSISFDSFGSIFEINPWYSQWRRVIVFDINRVFFHIVCSRLTEEYSWPF